MLSFRSSNSEDSSICLLLSLYESVIENRGTSTVACCACVHGLRCVHSLVARLERLLLREVSLVSCRDRSYLCLTVHLIAGQGRGLVVVGLIVSLVHFI